MKRRRRKCRERIFCMIYVRFKVFGNVGFVMAVISSSCIASEVLAFKFGEVVWRERNFI